MLYHSYYFKCLQSLKTTVIQEWEFYILSVLIIYSMEFYRTFEFLQTFYEIGKLVKGHSKRACKLVVIIFKKIGKEFWRV